MPNPKDPASFNAIALYGADQVTELPEFNLRFTMPPQELRRHVAEVMAQGLYRAKLPWLPGEKIVAGDLDGVASFLIGALMGLESAQKRSN